MPGFLKLLLSEKLVCVCVPAPRLLKTFHVKRSLNNQSNKSYCFQFLHMTLDIDITDGRGLSDKAYVNHSQRRARHTIHFTVKDV